MRDINVITARLQSDLLEKIFGHYRQMSGGRILETLESSVKLWGLLKEGIDLFESNVLKTTEIDKKDVGKLLPGA